MSDPILLAYDGCQTCKHAIKWLSGRKFAVTIRPIVEKPPTVAELKKWIPKSGLNVRKWLNTSGQSYRALGKDKIDAATDDQLIEWLAADGKLVKRPVLVHGERVLVGFKEDVYRNHFQK